MSRYPILLISLLVAGSTALAAPGRTISGPEAFTYAGAEIDENGNGFVAWKDTESGRSQLERLRAYEKIAYWTFEGYVVKGIRGGGDGRILLQGVASDGRELRLVETAGEELKLLWSSASSPPVTAGGSDDSLSVSRDLRWWYTVQFEPTTALVTAGRIGDPEPRVQWTVDVGGRDTELAVLVDAASTDQGPMLALAVDGEAWLMRPGNVVPQPLLRPERCASIYTLQAGGQRLWADCGSEGHAIYPLGGGGGSQPLGAVAVMEPGDFRVLADGRALSIVRRHGAPGTMRLLAFSADGDIRRGRESPIPASLGTPAHLAGEKVLVLRSDRSSARQVYAVLPVPG